MPVVSAAGSVSAPDLTPHTAGTPSAAVETLTRRSDFLRASRGVRAAMPGFVLQMVAGEPGKIRVGYTCSKKVGNAVARNRAKRRLRALAADVLSEAGRPGTDYVLVGRAGTTAALPFAQLRADLKRALARLHGATS
ncbi:MAG: ribonuclease P protein component [Pseudomonadota bacterium]